MINNIFQIKLSVFRPSYRLKGNKINPINEQFICFCQESKISLLLIRFAIFPDNAIDYYSIKKYYCNI